MNYYKISYAFREKSYNIVHAEGKYYRDRQEGGGSKVHRTDVKQQKASSRGDKMATVRRQEKEKKMEKKAGRTRLV